jgi:hypothetical protein
MAIPEAQLETWAHLPGTTSYQNSYNAVKNAIAESQALQVRDFEVYLQGSYKNSTNIRGDSDVDIVVQLNEVFYSDISQLSPEEQQRYNSERIPATYSLAEFKAQVILALQNYFSPSSVSLGNKSIKLSGNQNRVTADIVVASEYRYYTSYTEYSKNYTSGIAFFPVGSSINIINYPKVHYDNGVRKHQATDNVFKQYVRIFKNINSKLIEDGVVNDDLAPSYFIECMIYNISNDSFAGNSYQDCMYKVLKYLEQSDFNNFETVSGMHWLCRGNQWNSTSARSFVDEVINYWNS